jgi:predicted DNA-binding transcriptional regulator YafY
MRRADRLFRIVQLLRQRRHVTTAQELARRLEVSVRTVYRDIADLALSGVPIEGEAGIGYRMAQGFDLPPLMFDSEETRALVLGARMVEAWADPKLAEAAKRALDKIDSVLPAPMRDIAAATALFSLGFSVKTEVRERLGELRALLERRTRLHLRYADAARRSSERTVCPLGLYFWGGAWTLAAYCELRQGHRNFRVDRILGFRDLGERFPDQAPYTLEAFIQTMESETPHE